MIHIGQTVHGYEDGHSLLASSQRLSYDAESTLLVLSDLSGQSFVSGFDEYLTGYPLAEASVYAFAKTWYAPEMERPGCVWTHTLLIKFGDLARLADLHVLEALFVRPTRKRSSWASYEQPLKLDEERSIARTSLSPELRTRMTNICDAVYASDDLTVIVPTVEGHPFEHPFISIWEQQWPRLRRSFTFCTGSIEGRELHGKAFDLQCIPANFAGIGNAPPERSIIVNGKSSFRKLSEPVLETIVVDLQSANVRLRAFMRNYGADAPAERTSFSYLVSTWLSLQKGISSQDEFVAVVLEVSKLFPRPNYVASLKRDLLTSARVDDQTIVLSIEERFLSITELSEESVDIAEAFDLREYIDQLIISNPQVMIEILERLIRYRNLNQFGQSVIFDAAHSLPWEAIDAHSSPQLLLVLLGTNSQLLSNAGVWRRLSGRAHEIVDIFSSKAASQEEWVELCHAALENAVPQAAGILFARAPFSLVPDVLNQLQEFKEYREDFGSWYVELEKRQPEVVAWLKIQSSLSGANQLGLSAVLDPSYVKNEGVRSILFSRVAEDWNARRLAFTLVATSKERGDEAAFIFSSSFRKLHRFVTNQNLEFYAWEILRPVLPELSMWSNWDTAERLRRYFCDRFVENRWPYSEFWRGLEGGEVTLEAFDYIASDKRLRAFGRDLIATADTHNLPEWQRALLPSLPRKLRA
jgi:hypothetical protein